ncbi:MAG: 16S rRNA (cytidine(1402)-2'-O)-methyltransferase [Symbiobacteriia bacterium]
MGRAGGDSAPQDGLLQVCATPIGNLGDITLRVLDALREADLIAAEDTRQTRKLLTHFDIHAELTSYHEHNKTGKGPEILAVLQRGKRVALVSDAGLPGVSDPGEDLIREALAAGIHVEVLPGASAALTALVGSGLPTGRFAFEGFLPRSGKERRSRLASLAEEPRTLILYEAPHRLRQTLADLLKALGDRPIAAARELTKRFEEFQRGRLSELIRRYEEEEPRGEYTLVVAGKDAAGDGEATPARPDGRATAAQSPPSAAELAARVQALEAQGLDRKEAMRQVAQAAGLPRREVYQACVQAGNAS